MSKFPEIKVEQSEISIEEGLKSACSSSEPFALQALGESMEPEFPDKCILLIQPTDHQISGAYVIAMVEGERWFRQYINDNQGERLVALHDAYPDIPLTGLKWEIEGIIIQRNIRRQIKHFSYED